MDGVLTVLGNVCECNVALFEIGLSTEAVLVGFVNFSITTFSIIISSTSILVVVESGVVEVVVGAVCE